MIPFMVLVVVFLVTLAVTRNWLRSARFAFAAMFLLTASAHFVPGQRESLVRMVPPVFPQPALIVAVTGILEILGAVGLLIARTARPAAGALALLVAAMFPANVYAAMNDLIVVGRPATPLVPRTLMQLLFIAGLVLIAMRSNTPRTGTKLA